MRRIVTICVVFVITILSAACGQTKVSIEGFTDIVSQINREPEQYDGQSVTIVGYFRSQDLLDEVFPGLPPTNRLRDWVIKDNSAAIYIADSELLPFPVTSQDIWRIVSVTGTVETRDVGTINHRKRKQVLLVLRGKRHSE